MTLLRSTVCLALVAFLAACGWRVEGGGVIAAPSGEPAGRATLTVAREAGWPTPLATVILPGGETFTGKVITATSEPRLGVGVGTGVGIGSRSGVGVGSTILLTGEERTNRASALLLSDAGRSMRCDIRMAQPGVFGSGGFAECTVSDGYTLALEF